MFYIKNVPNWERAVRIIMSLILGAYAIMGNLSQGLEVTLWVVALMMLVTGFIGFCPMCAMVGRKIAKKD